MKWIREYEYCDAKKECASGLNAKQQKYALPCQNTLQVYTRTTATCPKQFPLYKTVNVTGK